MGLLTIIKKSKIKDREIRILILGLDGSGKTTFVKRLKNEDTSTISPTVGFNVDTIAINTFNVSLWDIGGQKSIREFWRNYFEKTDALIWVVDSAAPQRFADCKAELDKVLMTERLEGASVCIACNKQDISGAVQSDEIATNLGLKDLRNRPYKVFDVSAVSGHNVSEVIEWTVSDIERRLFMYETVTSE